MIWRHGLRNSVDVGVTHSSPSSYRCCKVQFFQIPEMGYQNSILEEACFQQFVDMRKCVWVSNDLLSCTIKKQVLTIIAMLDSEW